MSDPDTGERTAFVVEGRPDHSILGGIVALVAGGVLVWLGGPLGALAGFALVCCWYALGPAYAFAVGQVGVVALAGGYPLQFLVAAEAAVFAVLLAPDLLDARGRRLAAGTVGLTAGLGAIGYAAHVTWDATWITALVVLGVSGLVAYGLHRYELVATGAVGRSGAAP